MNKFVQHLAATISILLCVSGAASAMSQSQIPAKFNIPFGNSAGPSYIRVIPQASQIGIQNCAASLTDGFPPLSFVPAAAGGCPPFGQDFNGILNQITQWSRWTQAYGGLPWDSAFSAAIGGYPKGATVQSNVLQGRIWFSTADNNTTNPDATTGAAGWTVLPGTYSPGTVIPVMSTTAPPNAVPANGLTVGNASSNATNRANADTFWLFSFLWSSCNTCTLYNSSGGVVSKGATAAADYALNYAIATPQMGGAGLTGVDTATSFLVGVPVQSGSRTVPGSILGENLHQLVNSELPAITPTFSGNPVTPTFSGFSGTVNVSGSLPNVAVGPLINGSTTGGPNGFQYPPALGTSLSASGSFTPSGAVSAITPSGSISPFGANGSHNTVARSFLTYWYLAL